MTAVAALPQTGISGPVFARRLVLATFVPLVVAAVALLAIPQQDRLLWLVAVVGAPHVAAGFAFYFDPDARDVLRSNPQRFYLAPLALIVGFGVFGGWAEGVDHRWATTALAGYFAWTFHHFTRQNYGVLVLATRGWGLPRPSDAESRMIRVGGWAAMIGGVRPLRGVVGPMFVPDAVIDVASVVALGLFVVTLVMLWQLREQDRRRVGLLAGLVLFQAPLLMAPPLLALGTYAAPHPVQYLTIMWHTRDGRERAGAIRTTVVLVLLALLGGHAIRSLSAGTEQELIGVASAVGRGLVAWHFVLDAGFWKMSNPEPRAYMKRRFAFL